jgi:DNA topoisomerase IA
MPPNKILCVAEKPAIAKAVAQHLSGGRINTVSQESVYLYLTVLTTATAFHPRK